MRTASQLVPPLVPPLRHPPLVLPRAAAAWRRRWPLPLLPPALTHAELPPLELGNVVEDRFQVALQHRKVSTCGACVGMRRGARKSRGGGRAGAGARAVHRWLGTTPEQLHTLRSVGAVRTWRVSERGSFRPRMYFTCSRGQRGAGAGGRVVGEEGELAARGPRFAASGGAGGQCARAQLPRGKHLLRSSPGASRETERVT